MSRIRLARLTADERDLRAFLARGGREFVSIDDSTGHPPSQYSLTFHVPGVVGLSRGLSEGSANVIKGPFEVRAQHQARMTLPSDYPYRPPQVHFSEPHLHPNIYPNGRLCWGVADDASWWRGGEGLGTLIERLLHLLIGRPDCVNPLSPANPEAVQPWVSNSTLFPLSSLSVPPEGGASRLAFRSIDP